MTGINRRKLIRWIGAAGIAAGSTASFAGRAFARPAGKRLPNVVFIMADDMGYADTSFTGSSHILTPAIDSLAQDGVHFTQGYASTPICSPTRTALLTGCYAQRFAIGLEEPVGPGMPKGTGVPFERPTIASVFKDLGYRTSLVGKWHLGDPPLHSPMKHGYDRFFGIVEGAADYFRHHMVMEGVDVGVGLARGDDPVNEDGYLTDLFGDEAVREIERDDDRPFFTSLHFNAPHWPWEGREDKIAAQTISSSFHFDGGSLAKYKEMVEQMDQNVAKVLAALTRTGKDRDTIVIFTSDNGGERFSQTWPFIGHKGEVLEGGVRVPLFMRWPGAIPAGSSSDQVMASMDFLPTLLALAGGNPAPIKGLDGLDLSAQTLGTAAARERPLFWRFRANDQAAVRLGDWKYVSIGGKEHLYNLAKDAHERAEQAIANPEKMAELKAMWSNWNAQMLPYPPVSFSEDVKNAYSDRY